MNSYWLFNWLDSHGIHSVKDARRALSNRTNLEDLREMVELAMKSAPNEMPGENVILAGRGLDLTKHLHCNTSVCRQRQVDELFRKAWHYFDSIVVDDAISHQVMQHWDRVVAEPYKLVRDIEVLLYLQRIKAEDLIEFKSRISARNPSIENFITCRPDLAMLKT